MKKCTKCDAGMPDAANFCGYCGMRLPEIERELASRTRSEAERPEQEKLREEERSNPQYIWERSKELVTVMSEVQAEVVKTGIFNKEYRYQPVQVQMEHRANSIGMKFVLIPGRNYYMGKFPVTQREWQAVMGNNPSHFKGDDLPVETVSIADCEEFIAKLNRMEGNQKYRLPTEEEWEHACRAGSRTTYCFGDDKSKLAEYAWYSDNSGSSTHGVGMKKPNAWGLHDMHGNVWEWTSTSQGSGRVICGGGWRHAAGRCTSANRNHYDPALRINLGLRLARTV